MPVVIEVHENVCLDKWFCIFFKKSNIFNVSLSFSGFVGFFISLYNRFFCFFHSLEAENFGNINMKGNICLVYHQVTFYFMFWLQLYPFPFDCRDTQEKVCLCDKNSTIFSFVVFLFFLSTKEARLETCLEYIWFEACCTASSFHQVQICINEWLTNMLFCWSNF